MTVADRIALRSFIEQRLVRMFGDSTILICPARTHAGSDCVPQLEESLRTGPLKMFWTLEEPPTTLPVLVNGLRWLW